jgi:hypothetical protein
MTHDPRCGEPRPVPFEKLNRVLAAIISRSVIDNDNRKFRKVLPDE